MEAPTKEAPTKLKVAANVKIFAFDISTPPLIKVELAEPSIVIPSTGNCK